MKRLDATDFATLAKGGGIYDKDNPELKPEFDRMWKRVTAFSKTVHELVEELERPFAYEIGKSRNYLQQGGRGRFYYPRFAWIRYVREGEKRNTPSVSLQLRPEGLSFSLDFAEKYEKEGNVSRDAFTRVVDRATPELETAGFERDPIYEWPRFSRGYLADDLEEMGDEEFAALARHDLEFLLPLYESLVGGASTESTVTRRRRTPPPPEEQDEPEPSGAEEHAEHGPAPSSAAQSVAAAALAQARGEPFQPAAAVSGGDAPSGGDIPASTVVRRRRVVIPEEDFRPRGGSRSGGPLRSEAPRSPGGAPTAPRPQRPPKPAAPPKRPVPEPRPMPEPSEQVSIVPPAVPETAPGLEVLAERKALLMWGPASVNLYDAAFRLTAALLRPQLTKLKKRHELLLDSLSDEELVDVVALALYEAPRGLSFIALQTHELVLHYVRNTGPYMRSLRGAVRGVIQSHVAGRAGDGLFTRAPNGNWTLTAEGRHYVDENFRYALQEAAKEKPRRYRIDDFATILHRDRDGYPPLLSVHERRPDTAGALRSVLIEGPVLKTVRRAARDSKSSHVLVVLGAGLDEIELPFGPIFPLLHGDNRGHGALAPTVHLPDAGSVAVPPNLHVVVGLRPGLRPGPALIERYRGIFGTVELPGDGAGAEASDAEPEEG